MADNVFTSILSNAKLGEIERPKPLPAGSYVALIKTWTFDQTKSEKKTPFARVELEIKAALDDVNQVDLEEFGSVDGKKVKHDFYLTENSLFGLQQFVLEHVGLDLQGMSLDQALPQTVNNQVGVKIKHEIDKNNPEIVYARVDGTFNPNA